MPQRALLPPLSVLEREARERFHVRSLRPAQREVLDALREGRDVLAVLPTGAGKSLAYQLPSVFLPKATVVVSPLLALMHDQKQKLEEVEVDVAKLDSTLTATETAATVDEIREGEHEVVFVTPERLDDPRYQAPLQASGASLFVVDEAHCASKWGHDFRPAYLGLRDAARALGRPPILALTATAPPDVANDIVAQLGMRDPVVITAGIERPNIFLEVARCPNDERKREALVAVAREADGPGIVYVATVRAANELVAELRELLGEDARVDGYHGKLPVRRREDVQERFMRGEIDVLVATNAFGLGIDKPDIRFVAHWQFPDSLESYYQEAGRAGRDGEAARAVLLYRLEDRRVQSYFIGGKYPRREQLVEVVGVFGGDVPVNGLSVREIAARTGVPERRARVVAAHLESAGLLVRKRGRLSKAREIASEAELAQVLGAYEERRETDRDRLDAMMHYAQTTSCRMRVLEDYFGEEAQGECGHCDNCRDDAARTLAAAVEEKPAQPLPPALEDAS